MRKLWRVSCALVSFVGLCVLSAETTYRIYFSLDDGTLITLTTHRKTLDEGDLDLMVSRTAHIEDAQKALALQLYKSFSDQPDLKEETVTWHVGGQKHVSPIASHELEGFYEEGVTFAIAGNPDAVLAVGAKALQHVQCLRFAAPSAFLGNFFPKDGLVGLHAFLEHFSSLTTVEFQGRFEPVRNFGLTAERRGMLVGSLPATVTTAILRDTTSGASLSLWIPARPQ